MLRDPQCFLLCETEEATKTAKSSAVFRPDGLCTVDLKHLGLTARNF